MLVKKPEPIDTELTIRNLLASGAKQIPAKLVRRLLADHESDWRATTKFADKIADALRNYGP